QNVRARHRPRETSLMNRQRVELQVETRQGPPVHLELHLRKFSLRPEGFQGWAEFHMFGHNPFVPAQAETRELQLNAAFAQLFEQRPLYDARQTNLVDVDQAPQHEQNQQPYRDSQPAEVNPANAPKPPLLPSRHISIIHEFPG